MHARHETKLQSLPSGTENTDIIVLGDEPLSTAWISESSALVRCVWADDEADLLQAISALDVASFEETEIAIMSQGSGQWILFDSAELGNQILGASEQAVLPIGAYRVEFGVRRSMSDAARESSCIDFVRRRPKYRPRMPQCRRFREPDEAEAIP
ncbi:Imm21 family immunity protein [Pendulispora rubella]|uniref:Imm21 family immunity protein n=1 Tax=Pendulispora rubella TaxID=2741070 RepID=UPI00374E07AD